MSLLVGTVPAAGQATSEASASVGVGVPDHPLPQSFDPTAIKDLKEADPGAGIVLMQPPSGNAQGDARLSYPIQLPPGRQGVEPNLGLAYGSSGGNGWVGLGWSLNVPAVSVDTQWGVPRYSEEEESETYLLDGQQLAPVAHRGAARPRSGDRQVFHPRVEGAFSQIIRHGSGPADYWWEMKDKQGTRYFYGGTPETGPLPAATLTDGTDTDGNGQADPANGFRWALHEVRDLNGNTMVYDYAEISDPGIDGGTVAGRQLYLTSINYTGSGSTSGAYTVTLRRDRDLRPHDADGNRRRPDVTIDARGGFKMVTADLLKRIEVRYRDELVRRYDLAYTEGAFQKTLLQSVTQRGADGSIFHTHTFDYNDETRGFDDPVAWSTGAAEAGDDKLGWDITTGTPADVLLDPLNTYLDEFGQASALSGSVTDSFGGHIYVGYNQFVPSKSGSAGAKLGFNYSVNNGTVQLIDLNGDGLPDKAFKDSTGNMWYRLNQSGPRGTTEFGDPVALPSLPALSSETSITASFGLEAYLGINGIANHAETFTNTSTYFSDVNADGLPDLVHDGRVLFNHLDGDNKPAFHPDSSRTPVRLPAASFDTSGMVADYSALRAQQEATFPLHDSLRRWVAPYSGRIDIGGDVALAGDDTLGASSSATADGVRVAVQLGDEELWHARIAGDDSSAHAPDLRSVAVQQGQPVYFRVQSVYDGAHDQVRWDPVITYVDVPAATDANGLDPYRYVASDDFVLAGRREMVTQMPLAGAVRLEGSLDKHGVTTDDVTVTVLHNAREIARRTVAWDATGPMDLGEDLDVEVDDTIAIHVHADSPVDLSQIGWARPPRLHYTRTDPEQPVADPSTGEPFFVFYPPYDIDLYPLNNLAGPQQAWTVPRSGQVTIFPRLEAPSPRGVSGEVTFTVKRQGQQVAKHRIPVVDGVPENGSVPLEVAEGDRLFFDFSSPDHAVTAALDWAAAAVDVRYEDEEESEAEPEDLRVPSAFHSAEPLDDLEEESVGVFPQAYRGWAVAGYNGNAPRDDAPIDQALLRVPRDAFGEADGEDCQREDYSDTDFSFEEFQASPCSPGQASAYPYMPVPEKGVWQGPDDLGWVGAAGMSSTRVGAPSINVPDQASVNPGSATGDGRRAGIARYGRTSQTAIGVNALAVGGSTSGMPPLPGSSYSEVDALDLNGDSFPDIVGNGRVQYSTPDGGLEEANEEVAALAREGEGGTGSGGARESGNTADNFGINANVPSPRGNGEGEVAAESTGVPGTEGTDNQQVTLGFGVGATWGRGSSDTRYDLTDINGDGLPDRVITVRNQQGTPRLEVALNLGYEFADPEPWATGTFGDGASRNSSVGPSLSFNTGTYDYAGGLSIGRNTSYGGCSEVTLAVGQRCDVPGYTLVDLNGDGLPDRVRTEPADPDQPEDTPELRAEINTGRGFAPEQTWQDNFTQDLTTSTGTTLGGGAYFTMAFPLCGVCFLIVNPGADYSRSMGRQTTALRDVDGDGYPDHVQSTSTGQMSVALNRTGRSNLLRTVTRPLGAAFHIDYERSGNTPDQPGSRWVMNAVTVDDGHEGDGVDPITTYRYADGMYDRREREFYGYSTVIEEHRDAGSLDEHGIPAPYRSIEREYRTDGYYTQGLLHREVLRDSEGKPYTETVHTHRLRDVATGEELVTQDGVTGVVFPELAATEKRFYEGSDAPGASTIVAYDYDEHGNVSRIVDGGDAGPEDDLTTILDYADCPATHVLATPTSTLVEGEGVARRSEADVDCATGTVTQVRQYLDDDTHALTDLDYFANGNLEAVTGPANLHGQRYNVAYGYDPDVATHITDITDSFGYRSTASYDPAHGQVETTTDINGNTTSYTYDTFGRLATITGPYQQDGDEPTIRFAYHHDAAVPWALTRHRDGFRDADDPIDTVVFIDGLGRVVQTKKDATVHAGDDQTPNDVMVVSGHASFDFAGRVVEQRYPVTEPTGQAGVFNTERDTVEPTALSYDVLNRTVQTVLPDQTTTNSSYGFGPDRLGQTRFETTVTDANGNEKKTYADVRGAVTAVQEFNTPEGQPTQVIWTSYAYDPLQQLLEVRDDQDNLTQMAYDNLGRRTVVDSPDAGRTETAYDLASNVTATITANLRTKDKQISYDYDFTRPAAISYPDFPGNNVTYTYGAPGAAHNRAGRLVTVTDQSGKEERFYGRLGEVVREVKTVASDTQGRSPNSPEVYTTAYVYDTFGRLQQLTYPDGEVLTYRYDSGGLVHSASGKKAGHTYEYVRRLEYDEFGQRVFTEAGNKVRTRYDYEPDNRRLQRLETASDDDQLQNLAYGYDNVGNITSLDNEVPVRTASEIGGPTSQTFEYDDLYRLTSAEGSYDQEPEKTSTYELGLQYDSIHNIVAKNQSHEVVQPSGTAITQQPTTYLWAYDYDGPQPHAATHIGDQAFRYDANGNQLGWEHDRNGTRRTITWDEENRVQAIADNGRTTTFKYDHSGQRVIKSGAQGETAYVNEHFSIRNREVGTKHVYVGPTRVVSKMMKQNESGENHGGSLPLEKDLYFFHPDHLGSSNYVTDADGKAFQHTEFFPSGETWIDESSNTQRTPYLYTGKELDEESGLYYYGARYYDPRQSQWLSTDPELPARMGSGSKPLNAYAYGLNNYMAVMDPDGRSDVYFDDYAAARASGNRAAAEYRKSHNLPTEVQGGHMAQVKQAVSAGISESQMNSQMEGLHSRRGQGLDATVTNPDGTTATRTRHTLVDRELEPQSRALAVQGAGQLDATSYGDATAELKWRMEGTGTTWRDILAKRASPLIDDAAKLLSRGYTMVGGVVTKLAVVGDAFQVWEWANTMENGYLDTGVFRVITSTERYRRFTDITPQASYLMPNDMI